MEAVVLCRFCATPATAVYAMDRGCFCYPDDREQALCPQHIDRASPLGSMVLVRELHIEQVRST